MSARTLDDVVKKYQRRKPAPPGSFCANCTSADHPMRMELGWNDDGVPVPICIRCSPSPAAVTLADRAGQTSAISRAHGLMAPDQVTDLIRRTREGSQRARDVAAERLRRVQPTSRGRKARL